MTPTGWTALVLAIACELVATACLKASLGFTRPWPSLLVVVGYAAAFYFLSITLKALPISVAYAIWSGVGTLGMALVGALLWKEPMDRTRVAAILLIVAGVVLLNLAGGHRAGDLVTETTE